MNLVGRISTEVFFKIPDEHGEFSICLKKHKFDLAALAETTHFAGARFRARKWQNR